MGGFEQGLFGERGHKIGHEITANCHSFCVQVMVQSEPWSFMLANY